MIRLLSDYVVFLKIGSLSTIFADPAQADYETMDRVLDAGLKQLKDRDQHVRKEPDPAELGGMNHDRIRQYLKLMTIRCATLQTTFIGAAKAETEILCHEAEHLVVV